ncbi:MAG: hypothetical protein ACRDOP_05645, partial [Gaiellaceae bacterium]
TLEKPFPGRGRHLPDARCSTGKSPHSRLAAATRRRIAALALARTHRYGLRTIATPGLVAAVPGGRAKHRPDI